ncbi:MAG: low molecular weight phosphotyrosine protein phosphatase [Clostridia bacterium]|nr:low molecular weight phosphotyrosine protein phosphatase [Clostridia bacterium]
MLKILFVCYGNICRSPMAEFVMAKKLAAYKAPALIKSKATSSEELGNPVYWATAKILDRLGVDYSKKCAEKLVPSDGVYYDFIIGMEESNVRAIKRIIGDNATARVLKLLDFTPTPSDIADPWYTRNFELTFEQIDNGTDYLIQYLKDNGYVY